MVLVTAVTKNPASTLPSQPLIHNQSASSSAANRSPATQVNLI
jgi:hypothetical protein